MTIKEAVQGNGTKLGIMACSSMIKKAETMLTSNETSSRMQESNNFSSADEILKFKQLLDQGIITKEEFERKKNELL